MQVQNNSHINFRGYGARPLKGLFLRNTKIDGFNKVAEQLEVIGQKQGFDVFVQNHDNILTGNFNTLSQYIGIRGGSGYTWCQDNITFLPDRTFMTNPRLVNKFNLALRDFLGVQNLNTAKHVAGGNYYIIDNNGIKELLLGEDDMKNAAYLAKMLKINSIKFISQADFHIDLFIRPLKDKTILVSDDTLWSKRLKQVISQIANDSSLTRVRNKLTEVYNMISVMCANIPNSKYATLSKVQEELTGCGYKPVKVPGRIFEYVNDDEGIVPQHILNYMNGIVHENKDGELVYITNKSNLNKYCGITEKVAQKIGFDFESEFINSVKDYIKPENIYFVDTQKFLKAFQGGIHCLAAEIPKFE